MPGFTFAAAAANNQSQEHRKSRVGSESPPLKELRESARECGPQEEHVAAERARRLRIRAAGRVTDTQSCSEGMCGPKQRRSADDELARLHGLDRATCLRDDAAILLQVSLVYVKTLMIQQVLAEPEWRDRLTAHTGPSTFAS
jgi:hypothetical protein